MGHHIAAFVGVYFIATGATLTLRDVKKPPLFVMGLFVFVGSILLAAGSP